MKLKNTCFSWFLGVITLMMGISSAPIYGDTSNGGMFSVASSPNGYFVAVWGELINGIPSIQAAHSTGGVWNSPVTISMQGNFSIEPQVGVDNLGNAVAIWRSTSKNQGFDFLEAAIFPFGGAWSNPLAISDPNERISTSNIELEVSPDGSVVAMWAQIIMVENQPDTQTFIRASFTTTTSGIWSTPTTLNP